MLVVGDDKAFRKQLCTLFESASGFEACLEAKGSAEALRKIKRLLPGLIVLKYSLPDMSGLEFAQKLKAFAPELLIFMLTKG